MNFLNELKRRNVFRVAIAYTVISWLILQAGDTLAPALHLPDWVNSALVFFLLLGFPLAVFFAWAFEMTPEGIKREKDIDRGQSITHKTGRKLDRTIITLLALLLIYFAVDKFYLQPLAQQETQQQLAEVDSAVVVEEAVEEASPSVAVLPFVNMSNDKDNEYFSDGLTETLLHMLAQLPNLHVAARTSSFAFKGKNASIEEIATALGVAHILEGSVQKAGEQVRITAQLIRADDGFHVWSQNYDRQLVDVFAIQDEIAKDVAGALDTSLLGSDIEIMQGVATTNIDAYENYLKGLEQQALFSYGGLDIAENNFKQALAADPEFTDARLALAQNYLLKSNTGMIKHEERRILIAPLIQQALIQQPENPLAQALELASKLSDDSGGLEKLNREVALAELRSLLPLLPTETYLRIMVATYTANFSDNTPEAIKILEAGLINDPLDANLHRRIGNLYSNLKRNNEALQALLKAQQLAPENPNTYTSLANLELLNNNLLEALEWRRKATEVDPLDHELAANIALELYDLELTEEGDRWYARVQALAPDSAVEKLVALVRFLASKENDKAIELCRSMITEQVENRYGAFGAATFTYKDLMLEAGKAKQAYDFLLSVQPDLKNYAVMPANLHAMLMQQSSVLLLAEFEFKEVFETAYNQVALNLDEAGIPWRDPENFPVVYDAAITGDIETAVELMLDGPLSRPVADSLFFRNKMPDTIMAEVYADPRVVNRMQERELEFTQFQQQVREMLLQPEWNQ